MNVINSKEMKAHFITRYHLEKSLSDALLASMQLIKIEKDEYLITQNSEITHLYCLVEGKLQTERYEINGERVVFSFETAFSIIGDLELFLTEETGFFSTVQAITDSYLLTFPMNIIKQKGLNELAFVTFICQELSKKLYHSSQRHSHAILSTEFKLRRYLTFRAQQEGDHFRLENRESLAAMFGVSVRQLNRAFMKLVALNLITLKSKNITIVNKNALSDIKA